MCLMVYALNVASTERTLLLYNQFKEKKKKAALLCQFGKSHYSPATAGSSHTSYVSGRVQEA